MRYAILILIGLLSACIDNSIDKQAADKGMECEVVEGLYVHDYIRSNRVMSPVYKCKKVPDQEAEISSD